MVHVIPVQVSALNVRDVLHAFVVQVLVCVCVCCVFHECAIMHAPSFAAGGVFVFMCVGVIKHALRVCH